MPLTGFSLINKLTHKKYWHYTNPLPIQQWRYSTHTTNHKINVRVIHRHAHTTHATAITHALRITTIATSAMTHAYMCAPYVYVSVAAFFQWPKRFTHKALPGKLPGTSIQSWLPKNWSRRRQFKWRQASRGLWHQRGPAGAARTAQGPQSLRIQLRVGRPGPWLAQNVANNCTCDSIFRVSCAWRLMQMA